MESEQMTMEKGTEEMIVTQLKELNIKMGEVIERSIRLEEKHDAKDKLFDMLVERVSKLERIVSKQGMNITKILTMLGSGGVIGYAIQHFMASKGAPIGP
jgi:hypothetical protein